MRTPLLGLGCLLSLGIASSAPAITMDWTFVGDPGNACDSQTQGCFGAVAYSYNIGTYEVTNAQYAGFLNAKAASDPFELYHTNMAGIGRQGSPGSYTYTTGGAVQNMPVNFVTFYDALRFANWMNNGQGSGDTETGAYTLLGGTATPSNGTTVTRNAGATTFLTSEDEWYKAAYYDSSSASYFDYPAGSDAQTTCSAPTAAANHANCGGTINQLTVRGSYTGSAGPYGTFDQGGNVAEWNDAIIDAAFRGLRGGSFNGTPVGLAASNGGGAVPTNPGNNRGFRLAMIPEPSTGLLVVAGLTGLAIRRRASTIPGQEACGGW